MSVYDDQDQKQDIDDLEKSWQQPARTPAHEAAVPASPEVRAHAAKQKQADGKSTDAKAAANGGFYKPDGAATTQKVAGAAAPEAAAAVSTVDKLKQRLAGTKKRKQTSAVTIVAVLLIGLVLVGIGAILPDELISLMNNLERHFFAKVTYDLDKESSKEESEETAKTLAKLSAECKSTADPCFKKLKESEVNEAETAEQDPLEGKGGLDYELDQYDFYGKLADKGFVFTWDEGRVFMNAEGLPGGKVDLTDFMNTEGANLFEDPRLVDSGVAESFQTAVEELLPTANANDFKGVTAGVIKLFGGRFCFADCDPGNETADRAKLTEAVEQKAAEDADYKAAQAVAITEDDMITDMIADNDPTDRTADTSDAYTDPVNVAQSQFDAAVSLDLNNQPPLDVSNLAQGETSLEELQTDGADGLADELADTISGDVADKVTAEATTTLADKISFIGWVQLGAQLESLIGKASGSEPAYDYKIHSVGATREFEPAASAASEQQSGEDHPQIDMTGSMTTALHASGTNAEASPEVAMAIDPQDHPNDTSANVRSYLVAHNEAFDATNNLLLTVSKLSNDIPFFKYQFDLASLITKIFNVALGPLNFLVAKLFGVLGINDLLAKAIGPLLQLAVNYIFPMPNLTHLSGEDRGTQIAEGTDVSSSVAGEQLGGKVLSPAADFALTNAQENADYQQFKQQPLFARMFNVNTPYSFVSQLALDIPASNLGGLVRTSFASLIDNPFGKLSGSLATILQSPRAFAAGTPQPDPTGILAYGVPLNDPVFNADPEAYWQQHDCAQQSAQGYPLWNSQVTVDPDTGQTIHTTTNGCLLIQRTALATGAIAGMTN